MRQDVIKMKLDAMVGHQVIRDVLKQFQILKGLGYQ